MLKWMECMESESERIMVGFCLEHTRVAVLLVKTINDLIILVESNSIYVSATVAGSVT